MKKHVQWMLFLAVILGCGRQPDTPLDPTQIAIGPKKEQVPPAEPKMPQESSSPFPADGAGKLLSELLQPEDRSGPVGHSLDKPNAMYREGDLDRVEIPVPAFQAQPPRLPPALPEIVVAPGSVLEEPGLPRDDPVLPDPEVVRLPTVSLMRWPSPDQGEPPPLPMLALPQPGTAPFTQPSTSATTEAALAGAIPLRTAPAPFLRLSLPDPFENRQPARLREPLPEDTTPRSPSSRPGP